MKETSKENPPVSPSPHVDCASAADRAVVAGVAFHSSANNPSQEDKSPSIPRPAMYSKDEIFRYE
jgi:hypothetical protein